jgi:serine O-acetyltransferase
MGGTGGLRARAGRWRRSLLGLRPADNTAWYWAAVRSQHPRFVVAVLADTELAARRRGDRYEFRNTADAVLQAFRLMIVTDAFFAQVCYRGKAACQARRIPVLPRVLHHMAVRRGQICIGDPVVMHAGVYIPHGQVVIDARTEVRAGVTLSPFTTLGRVASRHGGPTIGVRASIGTGARVLGPVTVGARANVGANAVVLSDVPDGSTAVGAPARIVSAQTRNET